jgi:hypothetical protein
MPQRVPSVMYTGLGTRGNKTLSHIPQTIQSKSLKYHILSYNFQVIAHRRERPAYWTAKMPPIAVHDVTPLS